MEVATCLSLCVVNKTCINYGFLRMRKKRRRKNQRRKRQPPRRRPSGSLLHQEARGKERMTARRRRLLVMVGAQTTSLKSLSRLAGVGTILKRFTRIFFLCPNSGSNPIKSQTFYQISPGRAPAKKTKKRDDSEGSSGEEWGAKKGSAKKGRKRVGFVI